MACIPAVNDSVTEFTHHLEYTTCLLIAGQREDTLFPLHLVNIVDRFLYHDENQVVTTIPICHLSIDVGIQTVAEDITKENAHNVKPELLRVNQQQGIAAMRDALNYLNNVSQQSITHPLQRLLPIQTVFDNFRCAVHSLEYTLDKNMKQCNLATWLNNGKARFENTEAKGGNDCPEGVMGWRGGGRVPGGEGWGEKRREVRRTQCLEGRRKLVIVRRGARGR